MDSAGNYQEIIKEKSKASKIGAAPRRTVILFLIDGLSYEVLAQQIKNNRLPSLEKFFLAGSQTMAKAHAVFPSLTFTNISSVLHEQPVHLTGALGNKMIYKDQLIDFESAADRKYFTETMRGNNIFSRLRLKFYQTVSLDYGLGPDASVDSSFDLQSGYALSQTDYRYLDLKKIDALKNLLTGTRLINWPDFVFVHLVGLDFVSHSFGPLSKEALEYLTSLDRDLSEVFKTLKNAETKRPIISILTADHGFALLAKNYLNIQAIAQKIDPQVRVVNESRMAALYYLSAPSESRLQARATQFLNQKGIETVVYKTANRIQIRKKSYSLAFDLVSTLQCTEGFVGMAVVGGLTFCSNQVPSEFQNYFDMFFIENIASYLSAAKAPDLTIIPDERTVFSKAGRGFHGGSTSDEVLVPLLLRNANLPPGPQIPALWQILKFVD